MRTPHKLAAVLFADIAGYSAMMTQNEELALEKLSIFKATLNKTTLIHSGKIIQYFGDGCLITFDSSVQAVECAVAIQEELGKGTLVPVRIGIHTGDVIFKEGNVYGDAVNVASRIESIGQPGTILVSDPVRKQAKGIKDFTFTSLGAFDFKNIDEPVIVYALSSQGFNVPTRASIERRLRASQGIRKLYQDFRKPMLWVLGAIATLLVVYYMNGEDWLNRDRVSPPVQELRSQGITIFPIKNETGNASYDTLKCYINQYLTEIFRINKIEVLNKSSLCLEERVLDVYKSQMFPSPELSEKLGSKYGLEAALLLSGDSILIYAAVMNITNEENLFDPISFLTNRENPTDGIFGLIETISIMWGLKEKPEMELPQTEWEAEYMRAISYFEKEHQPTKIREHLSNCKRIDSTRYEADILTLEVARAFGQEDKAIDSILSYLAAKDRNQELTEGQSNLFKVHLAIRNNQYEAAIEHYKKEYEKAPTNLWNNFNMISHAVQLVNDYDLAVEAGAKIEDERMDYHDCAYCKSRLTLLTRAQIEKGQYEDALRSLEYAQKMELDTQSAGNWELQIRALIRLNDEERLNEQLELSQFKDFYPKRDYPYFLFITAYEYYVSGNPVKAKEYFDLHEKEISDKESITVRSRTGRMQTFLEDYEGAISNLKEVTTHYRKNSHRWPHFFDGYYGFALARSGNTEEALATIELLENTKSSEFQSAKNAYYQAQIYAGLGDVEQAIKHLRESRARGKRFYRWDFQNDPLFKEIMDDPRFLKIISNT